MEGGKGAFANVLAWCSGKEDYERTVRTAVGKDLLIVIGLENVEPFLQRTLRENISEEFEELAEVTRLTQGVAFDSFHVYEKVDS